MYQSVEFGVVYKKTRGRTRTSGFLLSGENQRRTRFLASETDFLPGAVSKKRSCIASDGIQGRSVGGGDAGAVQTTKFPIGPCPAVLGCIAHMFTVISPSSAP